MESIDLGVTQWFTTTSWLPISQTLVKLDTYQDLPQSTSPNEDAASKAGCFIGANQTQQVMQRKLCQSEYYQDKISKSTTAIQRA